MIQISSLLVCLKWSKTHQVPGIPATIPIPSLPGHCTDPLAAYHHMLHAVPTRHPNEPLLSLPNGRLITCRYLQRALCCILRALGLPATAFSLHALRRGAAQAAFQAGANFVAVKQHGLLQSDAVLNYLQLHQGLTSACPRPWPGPRISICNVWGCNPEDSGLRLMNTTLYNKLFSKPHFLWHLASQLNWTRHLLVFNISRHASWRVL